MGSSDEEEVFVDILKEYGSAGEDFGAKAWLYEEAVEK